MVDNQHKKIKGYRDLTKDEIALTNEAKELAEQCGKLVYKLQVTHSQSGNYCIDPRWLSIGKTDLQKGFMALVRSIARPEIF